jgi:vacuolar-type H+-ATPase subunit H
VLSGNTSPNTRYSLLSRSTTLSGTIDILPDSVIARNSPVPITSRYPISMPGWWFPTTSGRAPNMTLADKIKEMVGQAIDKAGPLVAQAADKAGPLVEKAKVKAGPYAEQAREKAGPIVEQAREKAGPIVEQAINKASPYAEMVAEKAGPIVEQAKVKAAPYVEKALPYAVKGVETVVVTADKATGGRYHDKIESVGQLIGDALNRNGKVNSEF